MYIIGELERCHHEPVDRHEDERRLRRPAEGGPLAEVVQRLQAAKLMPPVKGVESGICVLITVTGELTAQLRADIAAALGGIAHRIEQRPPVHDVDYRAAGAERS